MPVKVETTHIILPRELIVYLRSDSDVWQCRLKVDNKWMARTTKERDVNKAVERAKRLLFEAQLRKEANIPVVTRKFRDIAKLAYQQMEEEETNAKVKAPVSYQQYKTIIKDYIIPFFGNHLVDKVSHDTLDAYRAYLAEKMGKPPAYSTMRKHNVTLNRIFDKAVEKGYLTQSNKPQLETKGRKSDEFPTFDVEEINAIVGNFPTWIANTINQEKREQRELLYDYVRVLIDTGARPGKELLNLQWKNVRYRVTWKNDPKQEIDDDGNVKFVNHDGYDAEGELIERSKLDATVSLSVSGKTNERIANGFEVTFEVLKEIVSRNYNDPTITLKTLTQSNNAGYVFRTRGGKEPSSFNHLFDRYLDEHNLLLDNRHNIDIQQRY